MAILVQVAACFTMARHSRKLKKIASNGNLCKGVYRSTAPCTRSRARPGTPIVMSKACNNCGEWRCRAHCKCARDKMVSGWSAARGASASSSVPSRAPAATVGPVGRVAAPQCELLDICTWYDQLCSDIASASEVEIATYMYDNPQLHACLLERLRGRSAFSLRLYLDEEVHKKAERPFNQRPRVAELKANGASVYICKGRRAGGSFHCKCAVVGRRFLYTGSPNFTTKSPDNEEFSFKVVGPVVKQVLERLARCRDKWPQL